MIHTADNKALVAGGQVRRCDTDATHGCIIGVQAKNTCAHTHTLSRVD